MERESHRGYCPRFKNITGKNEEEKNSGRKVRDWRERRRHSEGLERRRRHSEGLEGEKEAQ